MLLSALSKRKCHIADNKTKRNDVLRFVAILEVASRQQCDIDVNTFTFRTVRNTFNLRTFRNTFNFQTVRSTFNSVTVRTINTSQLDLEFNTFRWSNCSNR